MITRASTSVTLARRHFDAHCPFCTTRLWYDIKEEPTGWKIRYSCLQPEGCGREFSPGRISKRDTGTEDEAYEWAERIGSRLY